MSPVSLSPFEPGHIPGALALSRAAGWAHGAADWEMLLPFSSGSVALADGQVVGTALRSDFTGGPSLVNMVLVAEHQRGQGLGRALVTSVLPGPHAPVQLVATPAGRPLYEALGFTEVSRLAQYVGVPTAAPAMGGATRARAEDLEAITALETRSFGGDRTALIRELWDRATLCVLRRAGQVVAFAACRPLGAGLVIGPVVAENLEDAQAVIAWHMGDHAGASFRLDTVEGSGLGPWLTGLGLTGLGLTLTAQPPLMQRGPARAMTHRYALTSQALG